MSNTQATHVGMLPTAASLFEKLPRFMRRHRLMTAWMKMTGENPRQLVRIRDKSFGYADMSDGFLRLIVIDGHFEEDFFAIADAMLSNGGTMLDVGANHGLLSFGMAGRHGSKIQFHLFEPNPRLVSSIQQTLPRYPAMRCELNAVAVSDREGVIGFKFYHHQTGMSHITEDAEDKVPVVTLDGYLAQRKIEHVELLKIDVEGFELSALRGAKQNLEAHRIAGVYFEYFEKWLRRAHPPEQLLEFFASLGYQVCFCRPYELDPRGGPTHTISKGLPGHGIGLLPITGHKLPEMTDLLAIPSENLVPLSA